jgi:hypothetical protein
MGVGTSSCAEFGKLYAQNPQIWENTYFSWAQGFMSGLNSALLKANGTSRNMNVITTDAQERRIRFYCNAHPLAMYEQAVFDLFNDMPMTTLHSGQATYDPFEAAPAR